MRMKTSKSRKNVVSLMMRLEERVVRGRGVKFFTDEEGREILNGWGVKSPND